MQPVRVDHAADSRLRFVFSGSVVTFKQAGGVTLGDIAQRLGERLSRRHGDPVAIDVTLPHRTMGAL